MHASSSKNNLQNGNDKHLYDIFLEEALVKSSYHRDRYELIKNLIVNEYSGREDLKIYFDYSSKEKLFIFKYSLKIILGPKTYKVNIIVHIPKTFPDNQPEFYLENVSSCIAIHEIYLRNQMINERTFQINIEKFYNQKNYKIGDIISILNLRFNKYFPVYKSTYYHFEKILGKNYLEKEILKEVIINSEYLKKKKKEEIQKEER